jgi:hypothetical protein
VRSAGARGVERHAGGALALDERTLLLAATTEPEAHRGIALAGGDVETLADRA